LRPVYLTANNHQGVMFHSCKTKAEVNTLFKRLAKHLHPDHGGENDLMVLLTEAKEKALSGLGSMSGLSSDDILGDAFKKAYQSADPEQEYPYWRSRRTHYYHSSMGRVHRTSHNARIIDDILAAAKKNPRIKTHLADKAKETMDKQGYISAAEFNELLMYYKHKKVDQYV